PGGIREISRELGDRPGGQNRVWWRGREHPRKFVARFRRYGSPTTGAQAAFDQHQCRPDLDDLRSSLGRASPPFTAGSGTRCTPVLHSGSTAPTMACGKQIVGALRQSRRFSTLAGGFAVLVAYS